MPVFETKRGKAAQLEPTPFANEDELQNFFEVNLEELLGIRFVATELNTGEKHGGRIDTVGLDEEGNPVIVEYKWDKSDSVLNQGLYYLDWLLDHRGDFELAVQKKLGDGVAVSWQNPRLILVASRYTKFDPYALNHMRTKIELLRYQRYSDGTFVLENIVEPISAKPQKHGDTPTVIVHGEEQYGLEYHRKKTTDELWELFLDLRDRLLALDGVEERANQKSQISYRTTKSFAAIDGKKTFIQCQFKGPEQIDDPEEMAQDIRSHQWGYQWIVKVKKAEDVDYAFKLLRDAYEREQ